MKNVVTISVEGNNQEGNRVLDSVVMVQPPLIIHPDLENQAEMVNE